MTEPTPSPVSATGGFFNKSCTTSLHASLLPVSLTLGAQFSMLRSAPPPRRSGTRTAWPRYPVPCLSTTANVLGTPVPSPGEVRIRQTRNKPRTEWHYRHEQYLIPSRFIPLFPPENYTTVLGGNIFRCGSITALNLSFIRSMRIRTIIRLTNHYDKRVDSLAMPNFAHGFVNFREIDMSQEDAVCEAVDQLLAPCYWPMLVQCADGATQTGLMAACFDKLMGAVEDMQDEFDLFMPQTDEHRRRLEDFEEKGFDRWKGRVQGTASRHRDPVPVEISLLYARGTTDGDDICEIIDETDATDTTDTEMDDSAELSDDASEPVQVYGRTDSFHPENSGMWIRPRADF